MKERIKIAFGKSRYCGAGGLEETFQGCITRCTNFNAALTTLKSEKQVCASTEVQAHMEQLATVGKGGVMKVTSNSLSVSQEMKNLRHIIESSESLKGCLSQA